MEKLYISPTQNTPEINLSPDENIFALKGTSAPEDVRSLYYPVVEWINVFVNSVISNKDTLYTKENPLHFHADFDYFNSSSAKFIYDIFMELKRLHVAEIPIVIKWFYDEEDIDMMEAGSDIAFLAEMDFEYIPKSKEE